LHLGQLGGGVDIRGLQRVAQGDLVAVQEVHRTDGLQLLVAVVSQLALYCVGEGDDRGGNGFVDHAPLRDEVLDDLLESINEVNVCVTAQCMDH
jgi:hypothetical protein